MDALNIGNKIKELRNEHDLSMDILYKKKEGRHLIQMPAPIRKMYKNHG